jgi:hypothetical protein
MEVSGVALRNVANELSSFSYPLVPVAQLCYTDGVEKQDLLEK